MRISDWSSDVCSSDLAQHRIAETGEQLDHRGLHRQIVLDHQDGFAAAHHRPDGGWLRLYLGLLGARQEIGRASCRERVCQYVSISVVAVSLKKKNITQ